MCPAAPIKRHRCCAGRDHIRLGRNRWACWCGAVVVVGWWWVPRESRELINIRNTPSAIFEEDIFPLSYSAFISFLFSLVSRKKKKEKRKKKETWIDKKTKRIAWDDRAESWCSDVIITYYRWIGSSGSSLERSLARGERRGGVKRRNR